MKKYVLTGGPGGGKTTVLTLLSAAGYRCAPEAARDIIADRLSRNLPSRPDPAEFAQQILTRDIEEYQRLQHLPDPVFFDRGVVDALCMLFLAGACTMSEVIEISSRYPFDSPVFLLPPWEAIYAQDRERDQSFEESVKIADRLRSWYVDLGYTVVDVPLSPPDQRMIFMLHAVGRS